MAIGYIPLPKYNPGPQGIDFSPLSRGIQSLTEGVKENRLMAQQRDIGTALSEGGYGAAADKAFAGGDLKTGLSLTQAESSEEDRDFNRNRLLAQDRRSAASDARSREIHGLNVQKTKGDIRDRLVKNVAGVAQMIRSEADPSRKAQMVQALINANPRMGEELSKLGLDPANPDAAMDMIIAEAQGLTQPKASEYKTFKPGQGIYRAGPQGMEIVREPTASGAPMTATSMKEVFEADEGAQASSNVLQSLDAALELNDKAYSGFGAQTRGYVGSLVGAEGGEATEELQNVVTRQVLDNLKATFGGMPTEGERQVLLDVQGSVNKSPEVRKRIFERARDSAQRRLEFNRAKAEGIRSGSYFQPGFGATQPAPQAAPTQAPQQNAPVQITTQQEYQALPPGTQYIAPDGSIRTKQ